ncbi:hypothetical protein HYH03_004190 [Edaphochlamys debaryana]|uniref:RAP domain-containing protein n=1 Tax=Edaphochlamys debaryana TaxID=47281 RepID=A0A835Y8A6_9CHLO|nr:hypothetical protein HYH03_004190 [Edaphochlamys debaryana]|eukprot:KAG2497928.1 hypothetical protein HYH03_004190 [Edaphochlamys debaryana]
MQLANASPRSSSGFMGLAPDDPAVARDLEALAALVETNLPSWTAERNVRRLNKATGAAAKLGSESSKDTALRRSIFDSLAGAYLPLAPELESAGDCIIPLYASSRAGYWGPASADGKGGLAVALLQRLSENGCGLMMKSRVSDQDYANLWLALAAAPPSVRACVDIPGLLDASTAGLLAIRDLSTQACSNILLACSRLELHGVERMAHHLTARLASDSARADVQHLANSLYALGELAEDVGHKPRPEDLKGLAREVVARLSAGSGRDTFIPQELSNMLFACAKLGFTAPAIVQPLALAAGKVANRMEPQSLANSAWALAKMGYTDQGWYAALLAAAEQPGILKGATSQTWSSLWYALALARHRPASRKLLELTAEAAGVLQRSAFSQACANLLWALANLRLYDERLVDALAVRLGDLLVQDPKQLTGQDLANSLWALAVMGGSALSRNGGLVEGLLREAERRWKEEGTGAFSKEELQQLWQAQLELEAMGGGLAGGALRAAVAKEASRLAAERAQSNASSAERQVAAALRRLQEQLGPLGAITAVQPGFEVEGLGRVADVVVELVGGRRVAVEFDGPTHFFANRPRESKAVDGSTLARNRQLERVFGAGNVLSVPWWQWAEAAARGDAVQRAYLAKLLGLGLDSPKAAEPAVLAD